VRASRLWPVASAMLALIVGSVAVESMAGHRSAETLRIEIVDNQASEEMDDLADFDEEGNAAVSAEQQLARGYALRREYDKALAAYDALLAQHPEDIRLRVEVAHWSFRAGLVERAADLLETALGAAPRDPVVLFEAGAVHQNQGHLKRAEREFRSAMELRPNHSRTRLALGELLRERGSLDAAADVLQPAATSGSNEERARALTLLGRCHMGLGHRVRARKLLAEAIERAPASVNTWIRASYAFLESDDPNDSQRALEHALGAAKLAPELGLIQRLLGRIHEERGAKDDALLAYRRSLALDPGSTKARRKLVQLALDAEDFDEARAQVRTLIDQAPDEPENLFLAGLAAARSHQQKQALEYYAKATQLRPDDYPEAWFNIAGLRRQAGDIDGAESAYQTAINQRPDYAAAWNNLGRLHLDQQRYDQATECFAQALAANGRFAPAWVNRGRLAYRQHRYSVARDAYGKAVELRPDDLSLVLTYAISQRKAGDPAGAITSYRQLLAKHPRYVKAWFNLGVALSMSQQLEEAKQAYETALSFAPGHAGALKNLGYTEARLGQLEPARAHLNDALDHEPSDSDTRLKLAELHLMGNDANGCRQEVERVLAQNDSNPSARAMLARCGE